MKLPLISDTILIPLLQENSVQAGSPDFPSDFIYPECVTRNAILFISITPFPVNDPISSMESYDPENNPSFTPFREIADHCSTPFGFLALHSIRETRQQRMERIMQSDTGKHYIFNQQAVASRLIQEAMPEVIVVLSASQPQDVESPWLGSKLILASQSGAFHWNGIPIFFSRPFYGANALEIPAFPRLKEQIRNVLFLKAKDKLAKEKLTYTFNGITTTSDDILTKNPKSKNSENPKC